MLHCAIICAALLSSAAACAAEPVGCDKFKWPLDRERALLATPAAVKSGDTLVTLPANAIGIALVPFAAARLPLPPQHPPKAAQSYAGFVRIDAPPKAGVYRVTLAEAAWVDVVQDGREVAAKAFSSALGCSGVRKSVKFEFDNEPLTIQVSGTTAHRVTLVVTPD
ncbi:MAG TPA: hypothetical protein VG270_14125 [Pseudolabrys sp.]|jgi:hypothetical protein|nr:hypothetical protein [Pseudolabrys sp.]